MQAETTTVMMQQVLEKLAHTHMDASGQNLVHLAQQLLKGKAIVQKTLNGALAVNLSTFEHLAIIPKDGPSEEQAADYEGFVRAAEQFS